MAVANPVPATISEVESVVQNGLEALRHAPMSSEIMAALEVLAPAGYKPVVQLEEDGRKKRSSAAATSWKPDTGEIVIYFEPIVPPAGAEASTASAMDRPAQEASAADAALQAQVEQCCQALAEAERSGKSFIAFKWFRDVALSSLPFEWASIPATRSAVLTRAIEAGRITTKKIPNPNAPLHPTTTVSLQPSGNSQPTKSRFRPIPVKGEPVSVTLLRDRGPY